MAMNLKSLSGIMIFSAIATLTSVQIAQAGHPEAPVRTYQPFAEEFNEASQRYSGNFFDKTEFLHQIGRYFGILRFPDEAISDDLRQVNQLYIEEQRRQFSSTPVIRTPDLVNPYNSSVMTAPPSDSIPTFGGN
ncbi:hypothetical protein [Okeania sp. SIO2B3]|uniref:hypothetical protein n=1 Tax=Okeania sp. SIO2B3 TaxID=2607784 RepID=UPI0013C22290|nr:hypothetical protein [Okeania sp. SIO2B3]NET42778.1 hypothetical protein [Okeania sp. SIO2B3]